MQSVTKSPVAYVKKSTNPKEDDFVFALFFTPQLDFWTFS